jgi:hypothetical protein
MHWHVAGKAWLTMSDGRSGQTSHRRWAWPENLPPKTLSGLIRRTWPQNCHFGTTAATIDAPPTRIPPLCRPQVKLCYDATPIRQVHAVLLCCAVRVLGCRRSREATIDYLEGVYYVYPGLSPLIYFLQVTH